MDNIDLLHYIEQARKSGMSDEQIKQGLLQGGWQSADIENAFKSTETPNIKTQNSTPKHIFRLMTWVFLIGLAIVAYLAAGYYFELSPFKQSPPPVPTFTPRPGRPSPTQSVLDTSTWKTYTNAQYGFEFKYPEGWLLRSESLKRIIVSNFEKPPPISEESIKNTADFQIDTRGNLNPNRQTPTSWFSSYTKDWEADVLSKNEVTVSTKPAIRIEIAEISRRAHYYILNGKDIIDISYSVDQPKFKNTYDQILSTFKFIDKTDTSNWKTYTNAQYGFEFKYPNEWKIDKDQQGLINLSKEYHTVQNRNPADISGVCLLSYYDVIRKPNEDLKTWLKRIALENGNPPPGDLTDITVGSKSGIKEMVREQGTIHSIYLSLNANRVLSVSLSCGQDVEIQGLKEFNQILSTFRFIGTNLTADQIFQEVSSQLNLARSQLIIFRIFGQDRVQYGLKAGTNYSYKYNGKWYLAGKTRDVEYVEDCTEFNEVPEQYKPPCYDPTTRQNKYMYSTGESVNYPHARATVYIGQ